MAPVISSPCSSACCTGAAPRQAGSSEKCRLTQPCTRDVEDRLRDERAVRDDRAAVGRELAQPRLERLVARVAGVSTSTPAASARSRTGLGRSVRPRPAGASGRVTTATTSWSLASSASSDGTAGDGRAGEDQPQRARPNSGCGLTLTTGGGVGPLGLPDRLERGLLGLGVEPVDEQHAVEVVGLVLDAAGEQVAALDRDRVAVDVLAVRDDVLLAHAVEGEVGQRQAALGAVLLLVAREVQHRVDEVAERVVDVVDEHPQADADLRRGEPDAGRLEHRVDEVLDEGAQLLVEGGDRSGGGAQHGVAEQADGTQGHTSRVGDGRSGASRDSHGARRQARTRGSSSMRTGSPLRALRSAGGRLERGGELRAGGARRPQQQPLLPVGGGHRPEHVARGRARAARPTTSATAGGRALHRRQAHRRREAELGALGQLARRRAGRVPAHQRLHRRERRGRRRTTTRPSRPGERRRGEPAAQRLLPRPQVGAAERRPAVEQQHRAVAAVGDRLGAGRADDERRRAGDGREDLVAPGGAHRRAGERPAELLGRAPGADHRRRAAGVPSHSGQRQSTAGRPHHRQASDGVGGRRRRAARRSARTGPACGRGRRPGSGRSRGAAPARAPARRRRARGGRRRRPRPAAGRPAPAGRARAGRRSCRRRAARGRARPRAAASSGRAQPDSTSSCASAVRACPPTSSAAPARWARSDEHLAHVRVRRARLGVQVVAVVPDDDQPEVAHRGEGRRAGADGDLHAAAQHRQPAAVAHGRAEVGAQRRRGDALLGQRAR